MFMVLGGEVKDANSTSRSLVIFAVALGYLANSAAKVPAASTAAVRVSASQMARSSSLARGCSRLGRQARTLAVRCTQQR